MEQMSSPRFEPRSKPAFLISIDTEGDDVWSRPREARTQNAAFLPRFQALCERFGFRPSYLTNCEMAESKVFRAFARDILARDTGEIGMHMHPWDTPPLTPLGKADWFEQPHPCEYPDELLRSKVDYMTKRLQDIFQIPILSHRAGRFGFNAAYCRALIELGYRIDCSVTPHISWREHKGLEGGSGGQDYRAFPSEPYYLDEDDIARPGASSLLEAPMTIVEGKRPWHREFARRLLGRRGPRYIWLRPDGRNLADLLYIVEQGKRSGAPYLQFTLHSSEFMPGGSPSFKTSAEIERLYQHLEILFSTIAQTFAGQTLSEFAIDFAAGRTFLGPK